MTFSEDIAEYNCYFVVEIFLLILFGIIVYCDTTSVASILCRATLAMIGAIVLICSVFAASIRKKGRDAELEFKQEMQDRG